MADQNIKQFTITWILFGLLFMSLISFATVFMFNNNPTGLGDAKQVFDDTGTSLNSKLIELPEDSDKLLNITSKTNPEVSFLGSRDSTATSYSLVGNSRGFFETSKIFIGWILTGAVGKMLLFVFSGMFSIVSLYWIIKLIRTGG